jgi:hypothetical protein
MGEFSPNSTFHSSVEHRFYGFVVNANGSVEFRAVALQQTVAPLGKSVFTFCQTEFHKALCNEKSAVYAPGNALTAGTDSRLCMS